jgi:hypothetical protein
MNCDLIVDVPGFHGDLNFQMMRADLAAFRDQLARSDEPASWPCEVALSSTDPGVELRFRVARTGKIEGSYRFTGGGVGMATLSGTFESDQTYLRLLLDQVQRVLAGTP